MSDCCQSPRPIALSPPAAAPIACPQCGQAGKSVSLLTLKHQVTPRHLATVETGSFAFCASRDCGVVYFNASGVALTQNDVRQRVTQKERGDAPLCYCFGFSANMVRDEIRATGDCTIQHRIAAEMKADRCACEIRNPQGSCCLGNVKAAVKAAMAELSRHTRT